MLAQEPGLVSSTFAIRCLLRSCGVSGRRKGLTHTRTGDCRAAASWGLLGSSRSHDRLPATISPPSGTPLPDWDADTSTLAFPLFPAGLPAIPYLVFSGALVLNLVSRIFSTVVVTSGYFCRLRRRDCPFVFSA